MFFKLIFSLCLLGYLGGVHGVNATDAQPTEEPPSVRFSKASMNQLANPCDDFYDFACGNWKKNDLVPETNHDLSTTKFFESSLDKLIEAFLKNTSDVENNSAADKAKRFYSSCLNLPNGIPKAIALLQGVVAKFPHLESNHSTESYWIDSDLALVEYGVSSLLQIKKFNIEGDANKEISIHYPQHIWFSKAQATGLVQMLLNKSIMVETYSNVADLVEFQRNLTVLSENLVEPETATLGEFIESHSHDSINWTHVFDVAFKGAANPNWKIRNYLKNSNQFDSFLQGTNQKTIFKYILMNFLSNYVDMFAQITAPTFSELCLVNTKVYFGAAIMPWLIEQTSAEEWHDNALKLYERIKASFIARINQSTHLDETIKQKATAKLESLRAIIGFTDEMKSRVHQDVAFEAYEVSEYFLETLLNLLKLKQRFELRSNSFPSLEIDYVHYSTEQNTFLIPLQYIQYPFYNKKYAEGGLGFIIAHELVTAFNNLENYELIQKLKEEQWSSDASSAGDQCLKSQLATVVHEHLNWTHGEPAIKLISDNLAARIAYDAHLKTLELEATANSEANVTRTKLHFTQLAQTMCTGQNSLILAKGDAREYHGLGPIRVNAIVQNMPEFVEAYQCAAGAKMNPEKKCIVL